MFWADKLLENVKGPQVVEDAWTPSGIVHMGSLKGPVIHDVLFKILEERGQEAKFLYGFDDFDPIDGLPAELQESLGKYMGVLISIAPAPSGNGSFGDFYGGKMKALLDQLDVKPEIYKTSEVYQSGKFDDAIRIVLDNVGKVRKVYAEIYKKEIDKDWFPFQVICPNCGKLGTTKVTDWDGKEVSFECSPDLVKWAKGCGEKGKLSPFGGNGKMPWKVEWAAAWYTFGVTIEGAGKDHGSAGGSYDVAMQILKDVFGKPQPLKLVYEFFLSSGKKMSSSKGVGMNGEELLEVLPPQVARFLMIKTPPNQQVEFNPHGTLVIPKLFDDYQRAEGEKEGDLSRAFALSQIGGKEKVPSVRFSVLAQWVQMPNMEEEIKKAGAENWAKYAKVWVEKYAPEEEKFIVQKELPEETKNLSVEQKKYLSTLSGKLDTKDAEGLQTGIYDLSKQLDIPSKDAFSSIYISLLGKDHGPKAAWLILSLDKDFVKNRFKEASK
ncbi:MAG: lysine--tRNA ligase [Candidatus Levyibacteriota bacterium]